MEVYNIYFSFRGVERKAYVQRFESNVWFVYLRDTDILNEIGGCIQFNGDAKPMNARTNTAVDAADLYKVIKMQLY